MSSYKVIIEPVALADLFEINDYIVRVLHEPAIATRIYHELKKQISTLSDLPKRHKVVDVERYAAVGLRMLPVKNYIVYYTVDDAVDAVHIIRVLYNRREWQDALSL